MAGLEAQLLGIVVRKEKPQLEEQKDTLVINIAEGKRTLITLEDELLRYFLTVGVKPTSLFKGLRNRYRYSIYNLIQNKTSTVGASIIL